MLPEGSADGPSEEQHGFTPSVLEFIQDHPAQERFACRRELEFWTQYYGTVAGGNSRQLPLKQQVTVARVRGWSRWCAQSGSLLSKQYRGSSRFGPEMQVPIQGSGVPPDHKRGEGGHFLQGGFYLMVPSSS